MCVLIYLITWIIETGGYRVWVGGWGRGAVGGNNNHVKGDETGVATTKEDEVTHEKEKVRLKDRDTG